MKLALHFMIILKVKLFIGIFSLRIEFPLWRFLRNYINLWRFARNYIIHSLFVRNYMKHWFSKHFVKFRWDSLSYWRCWNSSFKIMQILYLIEILYWLTDKFKLEALFHKMAILFPFNQVMIIDFSSNYIYFFIRLIQYIINQLNYWLLPLNLLHQLLQQILYFISLFHWFYYLLTFSQILVIFHLIQPSFTHHQSNLNKVSKLNLIKVLVSQFNLE